MGVMKCAVFSCLGLGDALISAILCHNLAQNGSDVTLYHPFFSAMQGWFSGFTIAPFPNDPSELERFDRLFFFYERSENMALFLSYAEQFYPEKTRILNPIASEKCDYPYWAEGRFDGRIPFGDNLERYCRERLFLDGVTKENGLMCPAGVERKRYPKRVILHATSSREGKNWPKKKYLALADRLKRHGYEPVFILTEEERALHPELPGPCLESLGAVAKYVAESGWMIGNCSGIGHLASYLGLPTVTICRSRKMSRFWRPSWAPGRVITPTDFVPNLKLFRMRDRHWKRFVSVRKVCGAFADLVSEHSEVGKTGD